MRIENDTIYPDDGCHLKCIDEDVCATSEVCLSIIDSPSNWIDITEQEYQQWLNRN